MKKILICTMLFLSSFLLIGCGEEMTPRQAVRDYMESYVTLDDSVIDQLNKYVDGNEELTNEHKVTYKEILRKQYSSLTYSILNERIEDNVAYVEVEINVKDLYKIRKETNEYYANNKNEFNDNNGVYDVSKFITFQLDKMKAATETVKYKLELKVVKSDDDWDVAQLSNSDLEKIHGIYNYEEE
jgi:hypothetical protein